MFKLSAFSSLDFCFVKLSPCINLFISIESSSSSGNLALYQSLVVIASICSFAHISIDSIILVWSFIIYFSFSVSIF